MQDEVMQQVFAIVKGQCSPTVVDRIKASHDWSAIHQPHNLIELLTLIRRSLYTGATTEPSSRVAGCIQLLPKLLARYTDELF